MNGRIHKGNGRIHKGNGRIHKGHGSESGIGFALNNVPAVQESCKVRKNIGRNGLWNRPIEA